MIKNCIEEKSASLFSWCEIKNDSKILYVGKESDAYIYNFLKTNHVCCRLIDEIAQDNWLERYMNYFDYILSVTDLEQVQNPIETLKAWKKLLNQNGKMYIALNNRMGIRYFCGDRDPYTKRNFDGVENYRTFYVNEQDSFIGRMYDLDCIKRMFNESGWEKEQLKIYSVFSDLKNPVLVYAENYIPREDLATRYFPTYNYPKTVFLEEEGLFEGLINNGMFHQMANSYVIECSLNRDLLDVLHVTNSVERGENDALLTVIHESGMVRKKALYECGKQRLRELCANCQRLVTNGVSVVTGKIENDEYIMPYVEFENGQVYLKELLKKDKEKFLEKMDLFKDTILKSSPIVQEDKGDGYGAILKNGYLDMVPLNSFYNNKEFVFFDQEFCRENCPANVIIYRMIGCFFAGNSELEKYIPMQELFERYNLKQNIKEWEKIANEFIYELRREKQQKQYLIECRRDPEIVYKNRKKLNYSEKVYKQLFEDILKNLGNKKIIIYGAGRYATRFISMYGKDYQIEYIVDGNPKNIGKKIKEIVVRTPDILQNIQKENYRVIICIKNYLRVQMQLEKIGGIEYGIYDPEKSYIRDNDCKAILSEKNEKINEKKYKIGYISGVFDMFHVGHLNLLRKAKEECEYLIVGVVSDEDVYLSKRKYPIIPTEDRVAIINSCKYVDKAEKLPVSCTRLRDSYNLYRYNVIFSGDDHKNDSNWLKEKQFLEEKNVDFVFFSYTEKVSSTQLREKISN